MTNEHQRRYNSDFCDTRHKALDEKIKNNKKDIEKLEKKLKSEISTYKLSTNNNVDNLDITLRGNGKVGLQEQVRTLQTQMKVAFILIFFFFGFKIMGNNLSDLTNHLKDDKTIKNTQTIEEEKKINITENKG